MGKRILFVLLLLIMPRAQAQTACPTGVAPGSAQCGPSPTYHGVGNASTGTYQPPAPVVMQQKWADRWGTIAYDELNPIIGTATGMKNRRISEKTALSQCRSKGGQKCKIAISYYNQCAALLAAKGGGLVTGNAASAEQAVKLGMNQCKEQGSDCSVYYTNCSMSEQYWVRQ